MYYIHILWKVQKYMKLGDIVLMIKFDVINEKYVSHIVLKNMKVSICKYLFLLMNKEGQTLKFNKKCSRMLSKKFNSKINAWGCLTVNENDIYLIKFVLQNSILKKYLDEDDFKNIKTKYALNVTYDEFNPFPYMITVNGENYILLYDVDTKSKNYVYNLKNKEKIF